MSVDEVLEKRKQYLDALYKAFSITAEGAYVYVADIENDLSKWSQKAVDYFGLPDEYMINAGEIWEKHIHPDDREGYKQSIDAVFSGKDEGHDMQYRAIDRKGKYTICTCRGTIIRNPKTNRPEYFVGTIKNHGNVGNIDQLTGLRNQYGFFEDLGSILFKQEEAVIAILGIDHFSNINDVYGYNFGNKVLVYFARKLTERLRNKGIIYRLDGTRFALITHMDKQFLVDSYDEIRSWALKGFEIEDKRVYFHCNASFLVLDSFDISEKTIFSCLNYAYRISKGDKQGDLVEFYNNLSAGNRKRIKRIHAIRDSVANNCEGFTLFYQPIVYAESGKLKGAEALIRWENKEYGMVFPDTFIDVLETDSIYPKLGNWILETAMRQGKEFLSRYPGFVMSVNLSYTQMEKSGFVNTVLDLLEKTEFPAENLCLELTERCRLLDMKVIRNIVMRLHVHGVKFALDDFGTGYSSTYMIKALPLDTIKIDRSYVQNLLEDRRERELVKYFVDIAALFGSDVCVEGIEDEQMEEIIRQYSVKSLQGYYYSKPISFDAFWDKYIHTGT